MVLHYKIYTILTGGWARGCLREGGGVGEGGRTGDGGFFTIIQLGTSAMTKKCKKCSK